jgi:hypothetical protein
MLFQRKNTQRTITHDTTRGNDGYRACDRATICTFQATIEREHDCNYDALRATLLRARDVNYIVSMRSLRATYNDVIARMYTFDR